MYLTVAKRRTIPMSYLLVNLQSTRCQALYGEGRVSRCTLFGLYRNDDTRIRKLSTNSKIGYESAIRNFFGPPNHGEGNGTRKTILT